MDFESDFQPRQIVCLEHARVCLYAEVVQPLESRPMCWVRPLLLAIPSAPGSQAQMYDLRQDADLIWPTALMRSALDTEVLPLLCVLYQNKSCPILPASTHQQLMQFVTQVWQAYPQVFQG
ncbi:hypothetical protein DO97_20245 [Neosynechococcus sphagnicola sy1]|uniref:Uncharacterized protein n=1 Tax=Neosynechococcus sphagnicola sy1 TaxID=1497020 RepID=A0A098TMB8_9CYAN|nr:hypothetical protein [Neosynechococcus sphagnicola]KGF73411.1 hypothetical protein DO97_20245 [Neosynechococcus sphagnicola sy1]